MKKKLLFKNFTLFFILILAFFLRFYRISKVPSSLDWDEVAIGWNANTIFHTRRDEFGTKLPLTFKSFGDYKSPLLIYLTAPVVGIFGLSEFSVRFPSAFLGSLTVLLIYFLVKELTETESVSLISALLLAISPWHLQFSRPAFEPNLALFFIVLGTLFFLKSFTKKLFLPLSALSFALSLYSYHSPKIFLPLFFIGLSLIFKEHLLKNKKYLIASIIFGAIIVFPLAKLHLVGEAGARFYGASIFYTEKEEKRPLDLKLISELGENYLSHFSPRFLFLGSDKDLRIKIKEVGPVYLIEAPFLIWGILKLFKKRKTKLSKFLFFWILVGPMPAMFGRDAPHSLRSFNMLPALIIVISFGILEFINWSKRLSKKLRLTTWSLFFLFYSLNVGFYLYSYYFRFPVYAAPAWQYGYKEMALYVKQKENEVDKIIITSSYGQPHIFVYFFQKRDSMEIFWGQMTKYMYRDINWEADKQLKNTLLVGTPEQIPLAAIPRWVKIEKEIYFPDGSVAFRIIKR